MTGIIILSTFAVYTISKADVQFSLSLIHTLTTHPSPLHRQECILISLLFPFISIYLEPHHQYRQYNAFRKASATSFTSFPPYLSPTNQPTTHTEPHPIPVHTLQLFCSHSFALSRPRPLVRLGAYWERKDEYNFYSFHHYIAFPLNKHTQCTHAMQPATRAHNLKRENILSR